MAALVGVRLMPAWLPALLIGAAFGMLSGVGAHRAVRTRRYRLAEEAELRPLSSAWLIWALPIVCALLSVAWWERPWLAALLGCYAVALGVLAAIDLDTRRLPDAITWPLAGATLLALVALTVAGDGTTGDLVRAVIGGLGLAAAYFALALIGGGSGMGLGDVKLALSLGAVLAYLSWSHLLLGVLASFLTAAAMGVWLIVARGGGRKTTLAFGPHMALGAVLVLALPAFSTLLGAA